MDGEVCALRRSVEKRIAAVAFVVVAVPVVVSADEGGGFGVVPFAVDDCGHGSRIHGVCLSPGSVAGFDGAKLPLKTGQCRLMP